MTDLSIIRADLDAVRGDLRELKKCQVQYFILSVGATAALLGLGTATERFVPGQIILLAPLAVVLPCWLIFFDKATTITRNVGYARVLELLVAGQGSGPKTHLGFERSLAKYRKAENKAEIPLTKPKLRETVSILLRTLFCCRVV